MRLKWLFNSLYIAFCVSLVCRVAGVPENLKLVLVQMLYRHGDRAPNRLYANDPNHKSSWPEGLGRLTKLGRNQHRNLGKFFRTHYETFMSSDPSEISVLSTEVSRCIQSAAANLQTFYPFNEPVEYQQQKKDTQIPIFFLPSDFDELLGSKVECPRYKDEKRKVMDAATSDFSTKYKEVFEFYSQYAGEEIKDWVAAVPLYDSLSIEKKHNLIVPEWADSYWHELEKIAETPYSRPSTIGLRLRAGPFLKHVIENLKAKIDGKSNLKFHVFSGHNVNILRLNYALNLGISKKVPYCATIILELYSGHMDSHFIRILYLNSSEPEKQIEPPHILTLDGCSEFCPLEHFIHYTRHLIPDDFREECKMPEYELQNLLSGMSKAVIGAIIILIIIIVFYPSFRLFYHKLRILKYELLHQKV